MNNNKTPHVLLWLVQQRNAAVGPTTPCRLVVRAMQQLHTKYLLVQGWDDAVRLPVDELDAVLVVRELDERPLNLFSLVLLLKPLVNAPFYVITSFMACASDLDNKGTQPTDVRLGRIHSCRRGVDEEIIQTCV